MATGPKALAPWRESTRQEWKARLDRFADAGLPVIAFCDREQVSVARFYYWKRRLGVDRSAASADAPRLLPVCLTAPAPPVELLLPGGTVLRLSPGCDLDFVRSLLATLGATSC
jgi:hypothetical protein